MAGKWNLRVKGLKLNNAMFSVIELYFNLGVAVETGDVLNFGTMGEFSQDVQIRMNTIGTGYPVICSSATYKPIDLSFSNVTITDLNKKIVLTQTVNNQPTTISTDLIIRYNDESNLGIIGGHGPGDFQGYSPYIIIHDEFSDKIVLVVASLGAIFYNNDAERISVIQSNNGIATVNEFIIPIDSPVTFTCEVYSLIDNIFFAFSQAIFNLFISSESLFLSILIFFIS